MSSSFHFVQMADPQFGMFADMSRHTDEEIAARRARGLNVRKAPRPISGFADETRLYSAAVEAVNRISPAFAVVCGDMVHNAESQAQVDELFRISAMVDDGVPLHFVSGNHDVGEAPTPDSLALYRERFGADNYSFRHGDCHFAVINSSLAFNPTNAPGEWRRLKQFLADDLSAAKRRGARHIIMFAHHPLFHRRADEIGDGWCVPDERRAELMAILRDYGAAAVFAGHLHRNQVAEDDGLLMVTTGAVGYPLGKDPSGFRLVTVGEDEISHRYYGLPDAQEEMQGA